MQKIIALDVDGVILDYQLWWKEAALSVGVTLNAIPGRENEWLMEDRYVLTEQQRRWIYAELCARVPYDLRVIPGAVSGVNALREAGWDIWFVTKAFEGCDRWEWGRRTQLKHLFGAWAVPRIIFTGEKYMVKADVLIDDNPENVKKFPGQGVLFTNWEDLVRDYTK